MGLGGLHIWHLLIILVIVMLLFGTKRLKGLGSDLGGAIKGFKESMGHGQDDDKPSKPELAGDEQTLAAGSDARPEVEKDNVRKSS